MSAPSPSYPLLRDLLPRIFWLRDQEGGGGALEALVQALAAEYDGLREQVEQLYDELFLATCEPRFVPLIGEGIGIDGLATASGPGVGDRAWVGRAIGLRRRKGTLAAAARGLNAATGWAAYALEERNVVGATASVREPQLGAPRLVDLSGRRPAAALREPWSRVGRGVAISGRPEIPGEPASLAVRPAGGPTPAGAAFHVWRLRSFPVQGRCARPAHDAPAHVRGRAFRFDPLGRDVRLFGVPAVPADPTRAPTPAELPLPLTVWQLEDELRARRPLRPAPVTVQGCERLAAADLGDWRAPAALARADAVVDPLRGRLLLAHPRHGAVHVDYAYGFPGELGGGPYGVAADYAPAPPGTAAIAVAQAGDGAERSLEAALAAAAGDRDAAIVVQDSATYAAPAGGWSLRVPARGQLRLASAPQAAPVLDGDVHVHLHRRGRLELSGLTISGTLHVHGEGELAIEHCTLAPQPGRTSLRAAEGVAVGLSFAIAGRAEVHDAALLAAIVDGPLTAPGALELEQVTALGPVDAGTLHAGDCIFRAPVKAAAGLARTSWLAHGSQVPERLRCSGPEAGVPRFASTRWGSSAYGQLQLGCPRAIAAGGSLGGEPGAYHWLGQPERFARIPAVLEDLLPAGTAASVVYVN